MIHAIVAVVVLLSIGFGLGRIKNAKNFEAKVKAEVAKVVADASAVKTKL